MSCFRIMESPLTVLMRLVLMSPFDVASFAFRMAFWEMLYRVEIHPPRVGTHRDEVVEAVAPVDPPLYRATRRNLARNCRPPSFLKGIRMPREYRFEPNNWPHS